MRTFVTIVLAVFAVLIAGWLVLRRADIPYQTLEATYVEPQSDFLILDDGVKIHMTDTGPRGAPVLVLVHGFAASLHTWADWRSALEGDFRIITLDLPGHGLSRVPEDQPVSMDYFVSVLADVTSQLGASHFALAGSSMGGEVAWRFALAHPDRVDRLILVDAAGWTPSAEDRSEQPLVFRLLRVPLVRWLVRDLDLSGLIRSGLEKSFADPGLVTPEMAKRYAELSRAPGHRGALLTLITRGDADGASNETLSRIAVPTLILWGKQDVVVPVRSAGKFEAAIPDARIIYYDKTGHLPQEEAAAKSAADARAFLGSQ